MYKQSSLFWVSIIDEEKLILAPALPQLGPFPAEVAFDGPVAGTERRAEVIGVKRLRPRPAVVVRRRLVDFRVGVNVLRPSYFLKV